MTREGHAGVFTTEAKEGGAGCEAGVGAGAVGGWARGLGVGWAGGFFAVAAWGGGLEPLTLSVSSLTWPANEAKAESKEVRRSRSSSWGREGVVGGGTVESRSAMPTSENIVAPSNTAFGQQR